MQLESAAIDLLMVLASSRRMPSEPVFERRSEPAKSTIVSKAFLKNFFFTAGVSMLGSVGKV